MFVDAKFCNFIFTGRFFKNYHAHNIPLIEYLNTMSLKKKWIQVEREGKKFIRTPNMAKMKEEKDIRTIKKEKGMKDDQISKVSRNCEH